VADRDAPRISVDRRPELTATARRLSLRHGHTLDLHGRIWGLDADLVAALIDYQERDAPDHRRGRAT
jgi:hypothetical protein